MYKLESRSMRENLVFYGLPEPPKPKNGEIMDNDYCEKKVKDMINILGVNTDDMKFDRAHRLGGDAAKKPRPIVVKFHSYTDREKVRIKSYDETIKNKLKELKQGIGVQSPQMYRDARKILMENAADERKKGHATKIIGNKLLLNNKPFQRFINGKVQTYSHDRRN
jgi:hypothetical protein